MQSLVIPIDQARRLAESLAALPMPYTASRPLMLILEQARVMDVPEPDKQELPNGG
jgi:hypothetical protein